MINFIEGNKLIAEFMGGKNHPLLIPYTPEPDDIWFNVDNYPEIHPDSSMWKLHELKYHSSWDWLMPVIKKIGELGEGYTLQDGRLYPIHYDLIGVRIEMAYQKVVDFIKWYNSSGIKFKE